MDHCRRTAGGDEGQKIGFAAGDLHPQNTAGVVIGVGEAILARTAGDLAEAVGRTDEDGRQQVPAPTTGDTARRYPHPVDGLRCLRDRDGVGHGVIIGFLPLFQTNSGRPATRRRRCKVHLSPFACQSSLPL